MAKFKSRLEQMERAAEAKKPNRRIVVCRHGPDEDCDCADGDDEKVIFHVVRDR